MYLSFGLAECMLPSTYIGLGRNCQGWYAYFSLSVVMMRLMASSATKAGSDSEESDDEFDPTAKKAKQKGKPRSKPPSSAIENARANLHTLDEHHDHLLSGSFDASFNGSGFGGIVPSSSQIDGGLDFNDDLFALPGGLDFGGDFGDDLARELGEGWGGSPVRARDELVDIKSTTLPD